MKTSIIVGFKAETGIPMKELEKRARARMEEYDLDLMVANLLEDVKSETTTALLLSPGKKPVQFKGRKTELARAIFDMITEA
jgi:phosphopantothenoylcysteine decarboxylase/phosphopantothenate--cysteine ligase